MNRFLPVTVAACLLAPVAWAGQKSKPEPPSATLNVTVLKGSNGKPVRNAEVVLHPVDKHGRQENEDLELKTHADGKASISGLPYGKLRVQVIARGFRTSGADYDINQPNIDITIKLQPPAPQFSIYK